MTKYIDKAALVAEIDDIESIAISEFNSNHSRYSEAGLDICHRLKNFVDTLEVKEVDLKKELQLFFYPHVPWGDYCKNEQEDIEEWSFKIAKHFFEIGLKVQKGE